MAEDLKLEDLDLSTAASLSSSELESLGLNKDDIFSAQQKATFMADKTLGLGQGAITSKQVDNKTIDSYINEIEKPTGSDVYSKQAAMYRAQGEGQVLRTQKNLSNLFGPTINLLKEREAASIARYTILKERMPEFDDSVIFGEGGVDKTPMPIADEIKSISSSVKEDLRMLSRLNPNDERYDEIRKRVEKNQGNIVKFDEINQKLLQIRNEGTDQSQWSTGMTDTERNMWLDIYSSNGKNIKIQDGKLVWTDERGATRNTYNIPDDNTVDRSHDDETYDVLRNTRGDNKNSEQYKRGGALSTLHWYGDQNPDGNDPGDVYSEKAAKKVQKSLNALGITDNDGNALEVDGKFGPKTREAFKKYLKVRGKLNEQHLDQYMTEEDAEKYRTSTTTGVGETRVIDLDSIKSGPTMISNGATVMDMTLRGNAQAFINSGGEVGSESYIQLIQQPLFEMNKLPNEDMKSLIFDGLNTDDKDLFTGMNTNDFLEGVIRNHYGEDLSQEEIQEKIELIRSGDVTQQYKDGKGGTSTLKTQFMNWYKGKIDEKIEEGKKDPLIGSVPGADGSTGGGGTGDGGTGTQYKFSDYTSSFGDGETYLPISTPITFKDKRVDADQIQVFFEDGQPIVQYLPDEDESREKVSKSEIIKIYQDIYKNTPKEDVETFVNEQIEASKEKAAEKKEKKKKEDKKLEPINKLSSKSATIGGRKVEDYLLSYGDDDFVINALNDEYAKLGFTFKYENLGAFDSDALKVSHKNRPNESYIIRFDTVNKDEENTQRLMAIMKAMYKNDYGAAQDAF